EVLSGSYTYEEVDPLNPPPPASDSEPDDAIEVENPIKNEDETVPISVYELENVKVKAECKKLKKELEEARGFVFEERPNEAIDVPIEDGKSSLSEPRGSPPDV
ncbi:hypothetical protein Tco_1098552, partial [Tanacetum coccineum]